MTHATYDPSLIEKVDDTHRIPVNFRDRFALGFLKCVRKTFDFATRYNPETMQEREWLTRILFLETVAGVPGMVAAMNRHLRSLRSL